MRRFAKNLGGWPARPRTIFDAAAHRRHEKAQERLYNAQQHLSRLASFRDPARFFMDHASSDAWELLQAARLQASAENKAAQAKAKLWLTMKPPNG